MWLSAKDKEKIERTLHRRHTKLDDPNFIGVAFGRSYWNDAAGPEKTPVVKYYFRKKLKQPRKSFRIPPKVTVRFKKHDHMVTAKIPTDVEVVSSLLQTGRYITEFPKQSVTTGLVVAWLAIDGRYRWGVVTVGHGFRGHSDMFVVVNFSSRNRPHGFVSHDSFRHHHLYANRVDAAPIQLAEKPVLDFLHNRGTDPYASSIRFLTPSGIERNMNGQTLSPKGIRNLRILGLERNPQRIQISTLPRMNNFVRVRSNVIDSFTPGTSGSVWTINGIPAVMQSGGSKTSRWREAGGQALSEVVGWTRSVVKTNRLKFVDYF